MTPDAASGPGPVQRASLVRPSPAVHTSFIDALREYHQDGLHQELDADVLADPAAFHRWTEQLRLEGSTGMAGNTRDRVPHQILWWTAEVQYLGRVRINLLLNDELLEFGGHIGYDIRPSARNHGHATALLASALRTAAEHGIDSALLTCAPDNLASRRVIERNGGVLQDVSRAGRLRYWCQTNARPVLARPRSSSSAARSGPSPQ